MRIRDFSDPAAIDTVHCPYNPRPIQQDWHRDPHRFVCIVSHRRSGKSYYSAAEIMERSLHLTRDHLPPAKRNLELAPPQYAFIAPTSDMAKDLGFEPMQRFLGEWPHEVKKTKPYQIRYPSQVLDETEVLVDFIGAHAIDNRRGRYYDGVVIDEYAEMPGSTWKAVVYPMLSDYRAWARIIGTSKGRNALYRLARQAEKDPKWGYHYCPASETGLIDAEELAIQRSELGQDLFDQEYELSWKAGVVGAYYGKYVDAADNEGRIGNVPYDPDLPVNTAWDLGVSDNMVVWFYQIDTRREEVRLIDHFEKDGISLIDTCRTIVRGRTDARDDDGKEIGRPYTYQTHNFPHDLRAREISTNEMREVYAVRELSGIGTVRIIEKQPIEDGIEAVRKIFPYCWFDRAHTADGLDMLSLYRVKYDEKLDTSTKPRKDLASHSADAFRILGHSLPPKLWAAWKTPRIVTPHPGGDWEDFDPNAPMDEIMDRFGGPSYFVGKLGRQRNEH